MKTSEFNSVKTARKVAKGQLKFYNEMMKAKIEEESLVKQYISNQIDKDMSAIRDAFTFTEKEEVMEDTDKKLFVVDTIVTFRNRYVIEATSLADAFDEVAMLDSGSESDIFDPFSSKALPELIIDGRKISEKKFLSMLEELKGTGEGSYWMGKDLIRKIDYAE